MRPRRRFAICLRRSVDGYNVIPSADGQLKAIEDLKDRAKNGEQLEKTQLKKIETESQVRGEIASLGGTA